MENYTDEQLKALNTLEWVEVLKENPELADKCDKVNGWEKFDSTNWHYLL